MILLFPASFVANSCDRSRTSQVAKLRLQNYLAGIPATLRSSSNVSFLRQANLLVLMSNNQWIDFSKNILILRKNFLKSGFDLVESQIIVNLNRYRNKGYTTVVFGNFVVTFLGEREDAAFVSIERLPYYIYVIVIYDGMICRATIISKYITILYIRIIQYTIPCYTVLLYCK